MKKITYPGQKIPGERLSRANLQYNMQMLTLELNAYLKYLSEVV